MEIIQPGEENINPDIRAVGENVVFAAGEHTPGKSKGQKVPAHELTYVMQKRLCDIGGKIMPDIQLRPNPCIKKITVNLSPLQSTDIEWNGTPQANATGSDIIFRYQQAKGIVILMILLELA